MDKVADVKAALAAFSRPEKEATFSWFFKTGPGQYGEGDVFIGAKVGETRSVAKRFKDLASHEIDELLASPIHEERQCGLFILVGQFNRAKTPGAQQEIFDHYLNLVFEGRVNNWDLVDATAPYLGAFLIGKPDAMELLEKLARSEKVWERRVAIVFTFAFIRVGELQETARISEILNEDKHDLIHKASGWMLREVGKKDLAELRKYLSRFAATMPRTALRYAIEKMEEPERQLWLAARSKRGTLG